MPKYLILEQLNLTLTDIPLLAGRERSRLLNYLLRWDYIDTLHACLDSLIPQNPKLVSLLDLRARAFEAQLRPADALPIMDQRLSMRASMTARALHARLYLANGDAYTARTIAQKLVDENPEKNTAWLTLAAIQVQMGDLDRAINTYRRVQERSPHSRPYLLGMMTVYAARNDWITASGYATRLLRIAEEEGPLPIPTLHRLRDYFASSDEVTRLADIDAEIMHRMGEELAEMQTYFAVAEESGVASQHPSVPETPTPAAPLTAENETPAHSQQLTSSIAVSDAERTRITHAVRQFFGFDTLQPGQVETVAAVLRGEDVLTILPTGGGKSLCYQLPALLDETGTTLVVSPLIALMKDQVESLPAAVRDHATTINSSLSGGELRRRLAQVAAGNYRLVYAAPERLRQPPFLHTLRQSGIKRLVIDEAHCVSVWGHDFRPDYLIMKRVRKLLGQPPLIAVTATAPPRVRRDIVQQLGEPQGGEPQSGVHIISGDSTRPNLRFEVFYAHNNDDKLAHLLAFCKASTGSGIVYAGTRARCERIAALLRRYGIAADHYHAGIAKRAAVQDDFMTGRSRIIVATIAFGMGIDKADVRFIIHFSPPDSLEAYYQEAGRAGRDGKPATCLMMYTSADRGVLTRHAREGVLPVEYLRAVYSTVRRQLNGKPVGVLSADALPPLGKDETAFRVALSVLEEAELLYRGPDLPRNFSLMLTDAPPAGHPGRAFCEALGLQNNAHYATDYLVENTRLTLDTLENTLLAWADEGWLTYQAGTRGIALRILPPPPDAATRMPTLLERYETIQGQRVDEITAYAETGRCRHGHINAYLGGRIINRCASCDNCVPSTPLPNPGLPDERTQMQAILRVLGSVYGWGKASLGSIMQGDPEAPTGGQQHKDFGALAFRSKSAIGTLIQRLERSGFIQKKQLDHGGVALEITSQGRNAIQNGNLLDDLIQPQRAKKRRKPRHRSASRTTSRQRTTRQTTLDGKEIAPPKVNENLYNALKTWRLALAQEKQVPAYVIFANNTLNEIAAHQPTTLNSLERIKGVGPRKLELYGESIVELVNEHI